MEFNTSEPIYLQIIADIKKKLVLDEIKPGEKLPSTRQLALDYQVNPNTAARIYKEMEAEGICLTKRGLGTFVTDSTELIQTIRDEMATRVIEHFISEMTTLGYSYKGMIEIIRERENQL